MAAAVITLGRQKYAVGLYWENSPGRGRVAQIAREAALQPGQQAEFFAVRPGNKSGRIPQFGLSSGSIIGQKSGMPVLAACLAGQIPGSWAGAFRLNEGVVVIVVRDDMIVPDGDLFFHDENEARDRLLQEMSFGGLQTIYAPESWSLPGADTVPMSLLLDSRADIKLQLVRLPRKVKMMIAGGIASFIAIIGGLLYWQEAADEAAKAEAQKRAAMMVPAMMQAPPPPPAPKYDRTWEHAPLARNVIQSCYEGLAHANITMPGWHVGHATCSGSSMTLTWGRDKQAGLPPADAKLNEGLNSATQTIPLVVVPARGAEDLNDPDVATKRYLLQNWPTPLATAAPDPLPPPPPGYTGPWNPPPAPWVKRSFTLTVPELPEAIDRMIGDLPGVVVDKMDYSLSGIKGSWSIGGVIYENRK